MKSVRIKRNKTKNVQVDRFCASILHASADSKPHIQRKFQELRTFAKRTFPKKGNFKLEWLKKILLKIDAIWYHDQLFRVISKLYGSMELSLDVDERKIAGYVLEEGESIGFHINRPLFMSLFPSSDTGYHVGGLVCKDQLECLLHVVLHETVHVALTICEKWKVQEDIEHHGETFLKIIRNMFGHTDSQHGLVLGLSHDLTLQEIRTRLKVGQNVQFFINDHWETGRVVKMSTKEIAVRQDLTKIVHAVHPGLIRLA
jgi:hypothetical protein